MELSALLRRFITAFNRKGTPSWSSALLICSPSSRSSPAFSILIIPRLLNYIVAVYLILIGVLGLGLIH